jgi:hypothetical protein
VTEESQQVALLEVELQELREELRASQIREELAQVMPHVVRTGPAPGKKTTRRLSEREKWRRRRLKQLEAGKTRNM